MGSRLEMEELIKLNGRNYSVKVCDTFWSQMKGLMFEVDPQNIIFKFDKPTKLKIHSFFVTKPFLAVWMMDDKIIHQENIKPWRNSIGPDKEFNKLVEIVEI